MGKMTLGDLLRARNHSAELREHTHGIKTLLLSAANDPDAHREVNIVVEFFAKAMDHFEGAILGKHEYCAVLLGDSKSLKYHYPVARILNVKDWKSAGMADISYPSHAYYDVWFWFYQWCQGNDLITYLTRRQTGDDAVWYEISVEPAGD